jgi:signal transduction histidine kinase
MIAPQKSNFRITLTLKLLMLILPLVCVPVSVVGFLSYQSSVDSVTRLSRNEQMLQASAAATKIDTIFQACIKDLQTLARLVGEQGPPSIRGQGPHETQRERTRQLFEDFLARSPYYHRIRISDSENKEIIGVPPYNQDSGFFENDRLDIVAEALRKSPQQVRISKITDDMEAGKFFIHFSLDATPSGSNPVGTLVVDLDYGKVMQLVQTISFGRQGYAFMVDSGGRIIAHPLYKPYEYNLAKFEDSRLREFVVDMISGGTGWKTFFQEGERAAAYAPVSSSGWSLAVSVPISEFVSEAKGLRSYVIHVVIVALALSAIAVFYLSFQILRPVRRLAAATERVAVGDLSEEIPVGSTDEFGMLTQSFNHMVLSLKQIQTQLVASERLISMGKLSSGVAHEIRNPLNAMKGAITYLQRRRPDDALSMEYTSIILEEIERLNRFVTEFLSFARQSNPKKVKTSLNGLITNILNLFCEQFHNKAILVDANLDDAIPDFPIDPQQLEQVFINVLVNAMDAMPKGGKLTVISTFQPPGRLPDDRCWVLTQIDDNGIGIAQQELEEIFEPFYSSKESGTGLGLPISRGIIEAHGGSLAVHSQKGNGTTIRIMLPVPADGSDHEEEKNEIET